MNRGTLARLPGARVAPTPARASGGARVTGQVNDTSGQTLGACPHCTEVVAIFASGRVEQHPELINVKGQPALGGMCRAGGRIFPHLKGVTA